MQVPLINGIYSDSKGDLRTAYPVNMVPVPKTQGVSNGYFRPSDGVIALGVGGPGIDRGAINWEGVCFRVMGTKLVSVDSAGTVTTLGDVTGTTQVSLDYSFDRLAISSNEKLFYWDVSTLTEVTDPDLGVCLDHVWIDGYFVTTDGEFLVVPDLTDPTNVNPLKYGSAEIDPDPIVGVDELNNELLAVGRYTIEAFNNIGGDLFPFSRIEGAKIPRGAVGTHAFAVYNDAIAFVGGGRNEPCAVWIGINGSSAKISTREIDEILAEYTEDQLALAVCEVSITKGWNQFIIRLSNKTLVYDSAASAVVGEPIWFVLASGVEADQKLRASNRVWCYGKWIVGDPESSAIGYLTETTSEQWGEPVGWELATGIVYNEGRGAIVNGMELVALTGRSKLGADPSVFTQYSTDGETWSNPNFIKAGKQGERNKRIAWRSQGILRNMRMQRFRGTSDSHMSVIRLNMELEPLAW